MANNANVYVQAPRPLPRVWATAETTYGRLEGDAYEPNPARRGAQEWLMGIKFVPFGHEDVTGASFDWCVPRLTTSTRVECDEVEFEPFIMELAMSAPTRYDGAAFQQYLVDHSLMQRSQLLAAQVERAVLADNPSLASEAMIINNTDQSALGALLAIEDALADVLDGGLGMIHMTPGVFSALSVQGGFRFDENGIWRTATGHAIVADSGYLGVDPDTEAVVEGELWMYGSGPVFAKVDAPVTLVTANPWERVDVLTNRYEFDAEQYGIAIFDPNTVVAARINTSDGNFLDEGTSSSAAPEFAGSAATDSANPDADYLWGYTFANAHVSEAGTVRVYNASSATGTPMLMVNLVAGESIDVQYAVGRPVSSGELFIDITGGTITGSVFVA